MSNRDTIIGVVVAAIIAASILGAVAPLGGCATWRGVQTDVHRVTNPNW